MHTETVYRKDEVEKACMEEAERQSKMTEQSLPMIGPLVNHLYYLGATEYTDQALAGTAPHIPQLDEYTQLYLDQLKRIDNPILAKAESMKFEEYTMKNT
eukprot:15362793-Ditylum_brightwellii.AAC.1